MRSREKGFVLDSASACARCILLSLFSISFIAFISVGSLLSMYFYSVLLFISDAPRYYFSWGSFTSFILILVVFIFGGFMSFLFLFWCFFFNIYGGSPILVQLLSVSSTVVPLFIKLHVDVLQFALFNILIYFARLFNICITSLWWCGAMVHFQCQRELPLQKFGYTIHAFTIKIVLLLNTP